MGDGVVEQLAHAPAALLPDQGTDRDSRVARVAHRQRPRARHHAGQEAREHLVEDVGALDRAAALAGVRERAPHRAVDRPRQVRVGADDHRVLAAELEHGALQAARAGLQHDPSRGQRPREAHLVDAPLDQRRADCRPAVDDLQQPLGQAGPREHPRDPLPGQRRVRRRLVDDPVAGHQRDRDVAERRRERLGRRPEDRDDAERLVAPARPRQRSQRPRDADLLAREDPRARLRQPLQRLDRRQQLHQLELCPRAPLLQAEQGDELVALVDHRLRRPRHVPRPVLRAQLPPQPLHRPRLAQSGLHALCRGDGQLGQRRAGDGAHAGQRGGGGSHAPHAARCGCAGRCEQRNLLVHLHLEIDDRRVFVAFEQLDDLRAFAAYVKAQP